MTAELARLSATELALGYRRGDFSPSEVLEAVLEVVHSQDPRLNAFCLLDVDHARTRAEESGARFHRGHSRSPLDGIPVSVKDVLLTARWETRRGSKALPPASPPGVDAPAPAALEAAGAVTIGKTTTPEIGWKAVTDSPLTGITRNPWDPELTPGGSSGGAAAAVATGMGVIAVGSDGGGSIRIPAAFSGVVGLKPTRGLVPLWPPSPFGLLSHVGPLTRTVDDMVVAMSVLGRPDARDVAFAHDRYEPVGPALSSTPLSRLRIGYCLDHPDLATDARVRTVIERSLSILEGAGAQLEPVILPLTGVAEAFRTLWYAGAAAATQVPEVRPEQLDPGLAAVAEQGARLDAVAYQRAIVRRETLIAEMDQLFGALDFVVTPTVPILPFGAGLEVPPDWGDDGWPSWTPFTWPFNVTGQPAISIPAGLAGSGLPVGLQAVARYGEDAGLLRFAAAFEAARGPLPPPPTEDGRR